MEKKTLNELVEKLRSAAGGNLKVVALYGSAATGEFHPKHSDYNLLCVLERMDTAELEKLRPAAQWWTRKGQPAPLVFTLDALRRSADSFAIELLDIKANHRVLLGEDVFATLEVPMDLHRVELERELRTNLIRLRQRFLVAPHDSKALIGLMTRSVSTFLTLFRHILISRSEQPPPTKREILTRLSALTGFDASSFHTILDVREGKRSAKHVDAGTTFRAYLDALSRIVEELDRHFTGSP